MAGLPTDVIRHSLRVAREHGYRVVKLEAEGEMFSAVLSEGVEQDVSLPFEAENAVVDSGPVLKPVSAPVVGYLKLKGELAVGQDLAAGDVVGEILALGIANEITSKVSGTIKEVLVEDGQAVEYGQPVAMVEVNL